MISISVKEIPVFLVSKDSRPLGRHVDTWLRALYGKGAKRKSRIVFLGLDSRNEREMTKRLPTPASSCEFCWFPCSQLYRVQLGIAQNAVIVSTCNSAAITAMVKAAGSTYPRLNQDLASLSSAAAGGAKAELSDVFEWIDERCRALELDATPTPPTGSGVQFLAMMEELLQAIAEVSGSRDAAGTQASAVQSS